MAKETTDKYTEAVGRRKTSVARVRIWPSAKSQFTVNGKEVKDYFKTEAERLIASHALARGLEGTSFKWTITAKVSSGGTHSQAEAVRHALSRALALAHPELRTKLKTLGYLRRDPRAKERRKFGLKKARKSPQWAKR